MNGDRRRFSTKATLPVLRPSRPSSFRQASDGFAVRATNGDRIEDALIRSGYPFEIAGLVYFGFYLVMTRRGNDRFSQRSKAFTLIASIVLVASVPFHYGAQPLGIILMLAVVALAMWSTYTDRRTPPAV